MYYALLPDGVHLPDGQTVSLQSDTHEENAVLVLLVRAEHPAEVFAISGCSNTCSVVIPLRDLLMSSYGTYQPAWLKY